MDQKDLRAKGHAVASALKQAERAAKHGKLTESDKWMKIAERQTAALEKLKAADAVEDGEELERIRQDLRDRIARYCTLNDLEKEWLAERETWCDEVVRCYHAGEAMPAPMRVCPTTQDMFVRCARDREEDLPAGLKQMIADQKVRMEARFAAEAAAEKAESKG